MVAASLSSVFHLFDPIFIVFVRGLPLLVPGSMPANVAESADAVAIANGMSTIVGAGSAGAAESAGAVTFGVRAPTPLT